MDKPFRTYDQQIELLRSKNLIINNEQSARSVLSEVGYFVLIGGYKHSFKNRTTGQYKDGTRFEDIVELYKFDTELRNLFFRYLLVVERTIKTRLSYVFCEAHGESQNEYLCELNYSNDPKLQQGIQRLINILSQLATNQSDYPYIEHNRTKHNNVPLWVLINAVTFGSTSKMFGFLPQNLQSRIAKNYPLNIKQLDQILSVLAKYRNACAHNERLFSYQTRDDIPDLPLHSKLNIGKRGNQYSNGKHDLFSVVISFRYLLPEDVFNSFKCELKDSITLFVKNCKSFPKSDLLAEMGFPENWENISQIQI